MIFQELDVKWKRQPRECTNSYPPESRPLARARLNAVTCRRTALALALSAVILGTVFLASLDHVFCASSDLTIDYLAWEPEHPVSGGPPAVNGRIRNVGDAPSSNNYTLSLYVDDWWIDGWLVRLVDRSGSDVA